MERCAGEIESWALGASEERYRSLLNSIDVGFCVIELLFDGDGSPVDCRLSSWICATPFGARLKSFGRKSTASDRR